MSIYDKASLVLIPSGTKTSKVYSQKPVSGDGDFTFSRSTAATRVNADGNIEKETQNLLLQSNTFDTTWANVNTTETGGQSDKDGGNTAWLLSKSAASARIEQSVSQSGVQTFSVYAKAGTLNWIRLNIDTAWAYYDLANGVVGTDLNNIVDHNIYDAGNGWYRCELVVNLSATIARIYPAQNDGDVSGTSGNIVIQDAQLEQGLVARDYIETTTAAVEGGITDNVPRLDYTDSSCPALLLEPQRSNNITQSEYFGAWSTLNSSVTNNSTTSPEGVTNAGLCEYNITSNNGYIRLAHTAAQTISFYVKYKDVQWIMVYLSGLGAGKFIDIQNGVVGGNVGSGATAEIIDAGNDWKRVILKSSSVNITQTSIYAAASDGSYASITLSGGIYLYGAQAEAGSYPTSYIPTYGASVTRNGEDPRLSGVDALIGQTQGTLFLEYDGLDSVGGNVWMNVAGETSFQDWIFVGQSGTQARAYFKAGNTIINNWQQSQNDGINKIAMVYKPNSIKVFIDGELVDTHTGSWTFSQTMGKIELNAGGTAVTGQGAIRQSLLLPTALTDQEAIDLTTL